MIGRITIFEVWAGLRGAPSVVDIVMSDALRHIER